MTLGYGRLARAFSVLLLFCGLLAPTAPTVAAQEGGDAGAAVSVTNDEGVAVGSIAVNDVIDPFTDFDPAYPPEAGTRFVALLVAFDADSGERFDIAPRAIVLQDDAGFLWNPANLFLPDDAVVPALSSQTLAPGSRVTGIVGYAVPEDREPARIFFQPESSRLVNLMPLTAEEAPAAGDAVEIADAEEGTGTVTVTEVADPFAGFDPSQPPPAGTRFVLITLAYENTSDGPFAVEPHSLVLRDANGSLWSTTSLSRADDADLVPDLTSTQLAPGDRISGVVAFAVPEEAGLAGLYAGPASTQLIQLADFAAAGADDVDREQATPAATPVSLIDEETSAAVTEACVDVAQWLERAQERVDQIEAVDVEDLTLEDLALLAEQFSQYAELAEAQLAEEAPEAVAGVNQALATALSEHADAVEQMVGAADEGKDPFQELMAGLDKLNRAGERLQEVDAELARIAQECGLP